MRIFIPTKGRSDAPVTAKQLIDAGLDFTMVLSHDEKPEHVARYFEMSECIAAPRRVTTISAKRQWILENSRGPKLVMLDDDLVFYARVSDSKFVRASPKQLRSMFKWLERVLDDYAHAGIVDKFMSNTTPRGYVESRRYNSVLAYNLKLWPTKPRPKFRILVSEEHDVHLQLATRGLPPIISTEWSKGTTYYNPGGCTGERSKRSELAGHKAFAKLWPDLVKVVPHKTNISGAAIRVRWAQAGKVRS